jgi:cell wall-associated NlpC family hydrolase
VKLDYAKDGIDMSRHILFLTICLLILLEAFMAVQSTGEEQGTYAALDSVLIGTLQHMLGNTGNDASNSLGEKAAENAKQLEGVSYGYGGKGFDLNSQKLASAQEIKNGYNWYNANTKANQRSSAIDCSGLVYWAFNMAGLSEKSSKAILPQHNANQLWTEDVNHNTDYKLDKSGYIQSTPPKFSELKPGDLLFLDTPDKKPGTIDHVAIYAGNGNVVQAASGNGVEVITYDQWLNKKIDKDTTYATYFAGYGPVKAADTESKSDLGGINFTSIKLTYISANTNLSGGVDFDILLKAHKAEGSSPIIDPINSTLTSATAFMTGLAVSDIKFWVNLMPWEPDRIIDRQLNQSEVGRIMLEADLQMKRDVSNYGNPCANETGKALWKLLDKKHDSLVQSCMEKFPGEIKDINNVWFLPVTRHWIVPDKVYAYTNGTQIYIINATLSIYSEPVAEYSSFRVDNQDIGDLSKDCIEELNKSAKEFGQYNKELEENMILPYVIADVNCGERYEDLRNVYVSLALAQWYKSRITPQMDIFRNDLDSSLPAILKATRSWNPNEIWENYVYSFENGEYGCWENATTKTATGAITQSNFRSSGGVDFYNIKEHLVEIKGVPSEVQDQINRAITKGYTSEGKDTLFGKRLHVNKSQDFPGSGNTSGSGSPPKSPPKFEEIKREESHHGHENQSHESQYQESPSLNMDGSISTCGPCPVGWNGPNETCHCWKCASECPPGWSGPNENCECSRLTCPAGWNGPNEKGECWRFEESA